MSKYISQYDEVVSSDSTDYYLLQRGTAYKKFTKANFFNQISNELGIGVSTLVGLADVDITYLSNGDTISYNSATETFEFVPISGGGASDLADLGDVTITGLATNDVIAWNGSAYVNDATYARVSSVTTGFIPRSTGSNTFTNGTMTDDGSSVGFNTATYTYSFSFGGNTTRSLGMVRHTTANTAGNTFSTYAGGATSGASDKNGGNYDIYAGIATGAGTSQFNVYTTAAGASGTTDRSPSLKLNINGSGTIEFTTSTANTKSRIGASLDTMCGVVQQNGLYLATPDGSYEYPISMSVGTDYKAYFGGGNNGFMFVKNPQSDSHPLVAMGTSVTNISAGCEGSYNYRYQFARVWNNGGNSTSMYVNTTGTNSISANVGLMELVNSVTNVNGSNYGLQISVTGSSTGTNQNVAISTTNGKTVFGATKGDYDVSFGATADRTFGVNREVVAAVGRKLSIYGGSACAGNTDLTGGNVEIITGIATGTGSADIIFQTTTAGATGTTDRTPTEKMRIKGLGNVGIGITSPSTSAMLDVTSTTMGVVLPRMTATQASAITPIEGLLLFATDTNGTFTSVGYWQYKSGAWASM